MKYFRKKLSFLLAFVILLTTMGTTVNASASQSAVISTESSSITNNTVIVTESGIYIKGTYYTKSEFIQLLNTAKEIEQKSTDGFSNNRSAIALVAGTWWIPGVGEIVITAAGVVVVASVAVAAGSWIYNAVSDWFAKRAFNKSVEDSVNNCDSNKQKYYE